MSYRITSAPRIDIECDTMPELLEAAYNHYIDDVMEGRRVDWCNADHLYESGEDDWVEMPAEKLEVFNDKLQARLRND